MECAGVSKPARAGHTGGRHSTHAEEARQCGRLDGYQAWEDVRQPLLELAAPRIESTLLTHFSFLCLFVSFVDSFTAVP